MDEWILEFNHVVWVSAPFTERMDIHVFQCFLVLLWQGKITFYLKQEKNYTNMFQKTLKILKFVKCFWDISDESDDEDHPDGLQFDTEPVVPTVITTVTTVITSVITQLCRQIPHSLICYKVSLMRRPSILKKTLSNFSNGGVLILARRNVRLTGYTISFLN